MSPLFMFIAKPAGGVDADAQAFLDAAGITDGTQVAAIDTLVKDLKAAGIWSKLKAVYPFIGGTASTHKWNLKDPRDLDAAFRLTFSGGWTHSANGALGNGSNTYANTYITPTSNLTENSTAVSIYCRTDSNGTYFDAGIGTAPNYLSLGLRISNIFYSDQYYRPPSGNIGTNRITATNNDSTGFYVSNRNSSTVYKCWKNGAQFGSTNTNTSQGWSALTTSILIGALRDNNNPLYFTNRQYAFSSIGDGLTDTEAEDYYDIVQAYQTALSRQV
jgi:hypothetical protein